MTRREERIKYTQTFNVKDVENEELKDIVRLAILDGAIWADKTMLDKACEWLMLNADDYIFEGVEEYSSAMRHDFIENFRKAMEL